MATVRQKFVNINQSLASKMTLLFGTMGCAYVFFAWSLLPIIFPNMQALVFYVSGAVIQLVALPLIMVGQSVLNQTSQDRSDEDHAMLMAELAELAEMRAMHVESQEQLKDLSIVRDDLVAIMKLLHINKAA